MLDLIKPFSAAAAVMLLAGCTFTGGISANKAADEFETDYSSVYAERVVFDGIANSQYQSSLNMSVDEDVTYAVNEFDAMAQELIGDMPENVKPILKITQNVKRLSPSFISFVEEHYIYIGGSHGNTVWFPRNICLTEEDPHELALKELFSADDYMEKLNVIIKDMTERDPETYSGLWSEPVITEENENQFYITDNELVIYFPPYTLSYYAKGFIEYPIRFTELEGILNDEYKEALTGGVQTKKGAGDVL